MQARNIKDLENVLKENKYCKEKILKKEAEYYNKNYLYGYGGHIVQMKGKVWIVFYEYLYDNLYKLVNKNKLLDYFNNDK